MNDNTFSGLRVAITGGTSGLGLALVKALRERGARVAFVARTAERVRATALAHPGTHGIVGDVARKDDIHPIALEITDGPVGKGEKRKGIIALDGDTLKLAYHSTDATAAAPKDFDAKKGSGNHSFTLKREKK